MRREMESGHVIQSLKRNYGSMENNIKMESKEFQKMLFIYNALDNGWSVKKQEDCYVFSKKHENKREIFHENYLENFIEKTMKMN